VQGIKAVFIVYDRVGQCEGVLDFCMGLHTKIMIHGNQYLALERPFLYPFLKFENSVMFLMLSTGPLPNFCRFS